MKVIFAGTPPFSAPALEALVNAGHEINLVLTKPDRPGGRGMRNIPSAVKLLAEKYGFAVQQPESLKRTGVEAMLTEVAADIMVVVAYGLILPPSVLNLPKFGCLNIHASLLPRWRGAAPIERAILAGDRETGISIMQMDQGLDTGAVLLQHPIPISENDTTETVRERLSKLGAACILEVLTSIEQGATNAFPQNDEEATYAAKIDKSEAEIDWRSDAEQIGRLVRAFNPYPGAYSRIRDISMKIWQASIKRDAKGEPGEILAIVPGGIVVASGDGGVVLEIVQKSGAKRLPADQFLLGHPLQRGDRFECRHD
ncbi:MAG TPA: methionyl-tRNA formyltransferase [Nitrosospira sp.]|nr:methionyl-tRNA formyltransferase [Nitrosospira sp.]